jgi:uncharacterized membrane protein
MDHPLHAMIIHYPIALLTVGLLVDLAALILKRAWLHHAALLLLVVGTVGLFAALRSGEAEEDRILETPAIHETLESHEDSAKTTFWYFAVITLSRGILVWRRRYTRTLTWAFVLVWALGAVLLARTAWYGGEMVFRHGAGVSAVRAAD